MRLQLAMALSYAQRKSHIVLDEKVFQVFCVGAPPQFFAFVTILGPTSSRQAWCRNGGSKLAGGP